MQRARGGHDAPFGLRLDLFDASSLARMRAGILASPYLGGSALSEAFEGTRGYSVIFTRPAIPRLVEELPHLRDFVERVLLSWCNAFYLNPLIMASGSEVGEHVDCTLAREGNRDLRPLFVTVLYVDVPKDLQGGELVLIDRGREVGRITPRRGGVAHFAGSLRHRVLPLQATSPRISLVCEQYRLDEQALSTTPAFQIIPGDRRYPEELSTTGGGLGA
jgi:hypothetical protein